MGCIYLKIYIYIIEIILQLETKKCGFTLGMKNREYTDNR